MPTVPAPLEIEEGGSPRPLTADDIKGDPGTPGTNGTNGTNGVKGDKGDQGDPGSDADATAAIAAHSADSTAVHGIADTSVLATASDITGRQPLDSDLTAIAALSTTSYGRAFLELANAGAGRTALGLGTAAVAATGDFDVAGAAASAQAASQPLDSDLTAIAALSTTSYGRAFLALADAAAGRTALGLGTAATSASSAFEVAGAAAAAQAASQPLDSDLTAIAALTTTSFGRAFLALADAAAARTAISAASTSHASTHQPGGSDAMAVDAAAATGSLRTLGTTSTAAAAGNDSRFPVMAVTAADVGPITAQTTLQTITGLAFTIGASATEMWLVEIWLLVNAANSTMDVKVGFTVPASATMLWGGMSGINNEVSGFGAHNASGAAPLALLTAGSTLGLSTGNLSSGASLAAVVFGGGTGGSVQAQYAQNTSDAGALKILKGSVLRATKLAA